MLAHLTSLSDIPPHLACVYARPRTFCEVIAILFPGQGAQRLGMGAQFFGRYPELTAEAGDVLGYAIDRLCLDDPDGLLGKTR